MFKWLAGKKSTEGSKPHSLMIDELKEQIKNNRGVFSFVPNFSHYLRDIKKPFKELNGKAVVKLLAASYFIHSLQ